MAVEHPRSINIHVSIVSKTQTSSSALQTTIYRETCLRNQVLIADVVTGFPVPVRTVMSHAFVQACGYVYARVHAHAALVLKVWWQLAPVSSSCSRREISFLHVRADQTLVPVTDVDSLLGG